MIKLKKNQIKKEIKNKIRVNLSNLCDYDILTKKKILINYESLI